jgi:DNA invertase Pin-like site-specific DNA recombinase
VTAKKLAVSYARWSDPKQDAGTSKRRQEDDFLAFCRTHNLTPSGRTYLDQGVSGFRGKHRKGGQLKELVEAAQAGAFGKGTVVVEAWDRLGRQIPNKQVRLIEELLETGVSIGVCRLNDTFSYADFGTHKWTTLAVFVQLAYQESKQKSDRVAAAWKARRDRARKEGKSLPCQPPAWAEVTGYVEKVGGTVRIIPERAAAVKRVFQLAGQGYGTTRIIRQLGKEGVRPFTADGTKGRTVSHLSGRWTRSYVQLILNDRRVLGEMQPHDRDGNKDGDAIKGYLPAVVTEEEFALARQEQARRLLGRGVNRDGRAYANTERQCKHANAFKGLLHHGLDGESFFLHKASQSAVPVLLNRSGEQGRARCVSFPYPTFEKAVLSVLREVKPEDVTPKGAAPDRTGVLKATLANLRRDVASLKADLKAKYSKALSDVLREKEAECETVTDRLQDEVAKAARPVEKAVEEVPGLIDLVEKEGDAARLRLRPALQRIIDGIWLVIVGRGKERWCSVQIWFVNGTMTRVVVRHRQPEGNGSAKKDGRWDCRSTPHVWSSDKLNVPDLRTKKGAERELARLESWKPTDSDWTCGGTIPAK